MNTKQLIEQNHLKRKELTPDNLEAYEKVLLYLRLDLSLSERVTEETLNDLLDHLLQSQMHGVTSKEFFGNDIEQYSKELVAEIPRESKRNLNLFALSMAALLFGIIHLMNGIITGIASVFNITQQPTNVGGTLLGETVFIVVGLASIYFLFSMLKKTVFQDDSRKNTILIGVGLWIILSAAFLAMMFFPKILPIGPYVNIAWYVSVIIGLVALAIYKISFKLSYH